MGALVKAAHALERKFLRTSEVRHPNRSFMFFDVLDHMNFDEVALKVGDGTTSDVLMSTIRWIQRASVEAPLIAMNEDDEAELESDLQAIIDTPNPFYSRQHLIQSTVFDLCMSGNSYWLPAVDGNGEIRELWWMPEFAIEPKFDERGVDVREEDAFIDYYQMTADGVEIRLKPDEVLHFRLGVDPRNTRKGLSPIRGLLREIVTDDEAAAFTAALLVNGGVPSLVITPTNPDDEIPQEEIDAAVARFQTKFSGSGRGKVMGLTGPVKIEQFGFSPEQMDLSALRDVTEERITAALGVPAAVVGFGAGLQTTRVGATMREMVQLAHHNGVIPLQRIIEEVLNQHLVDEFDGVESVVFDLSEVQALREDQNALASRVDRLVARSVLTRREARIELGFDGGDEGGPDDVYLMPLSTVEVPRGANGNRGDLARARLEERGLSSPAQMKQADRDVPRGMLTEPIQGSVAEILATEIAPRLVSRPTLEMARFAMAINRLRQPDSPLVRRFSASIERAFREFGRRVEDAVLEALNATTVDFEERSSVRGVETKQVDEELLERVLIDLLPGLEDELRAVFDDGFSLAADRVSDALQSELGITFRINEQAQIEILRAGGTRLGLLDISRDVIDAMFEVLAEARAEGLANEALARRIRDAIVAGPWRSVETRARVIARTEGAHAANVATLIAARQMDDTDHVLVLDDLGAFSEEDPEHTICAEVNGLIVTIAHAEIMGLAHPNCTRNFTPLNSAAMDELREQGLIEDPLTGALRRVPTESEVIEVTQEDVLEALRSSPFDAEMDLGGSVNPVRRVQFLMVDGSETVAYWKPVRGVDWIDARLEPSGGTSGDREVLAREIDRHMGFDLVPPTFYREHNGVPGTIQLRFDGRTFGMLDIGEDQGILADIRNENRFELWVFDVLIGETDRHAGNWMIDDDFNIAAIDNGFSFLNSDLSMLAGNPRFPVDVYDALRDLSESERAVLVERLTDPDLIQIVRDSPINDKGLIDFDTRRDFLVNILSLDLEDLADEWVGFIPGHPDKA